MAKPYSPGDEPIQGYRLTRFLGRGGFGEVWQATAPGGTEVALKIISLAGKSGWKEFRSINLVKRIRHPNLTPIISFWLKDDRGNLIAEEAGGDQDLQPSPSDGDVVKGTLRASDFAGVPQPAELIVAMGLGDRNLDDRLQECRRQGSPGISADELLGYLEDAAKAIDHLNHPIHELGHGPGSSIQHCDIKPQNILVVGGAAQVCDFGLARVLGDTRVTSAAMSPAYAAPEYLEKNIPASSTDQCSLALTYFELRTGRLPFDNETFSGVISAHRNGTLNLDALDEAERTVIRRATAYDPQRRFASAGEMIRALRGAVAGVTEPGVQPPDARSRPVAGRVTAGSIIVPGYQVNRLIAEFDDEEIWEATGPDGRPAALIRRPIEAEMTSARLAIFELCKTLNHPHVTRIHDYWILDDRGAALSLSRANHRDLAGARWLVLAGDVARSSLRDRLDQCVKTTGGGIPVRELTRYMKQAAAGIDYLNAPEHSVDRQSVCIIHRSVGPHNLLLHGDTVKVGNYGNAQLLPAENRIAALAGSTLACNRAYASPEELHKNLISRWSDQFALAVTYVELRTGRPPRPTEVLTDEARRIVPGLDLLTDSEAEIVSRATATDQGSRFESCTEMVAELEAACQAAGLFESTPMVAAEQEGSLRAESAQEPPTSLEKPDRKPRGKSEVTVAWQGDDGPQEPSDVARRESPDTKLIKDTERDHRGSRERKVAEAEGHDANVLGGRYELLDKVGEGTYAVVYRARDRNLDSLRAVKVLKIELAPDVTVLRQLGELFRREARTLDAIDHPCVVRVYDADVSPAGIPYIVYEFLEGKLLGTIITGEGPLRLERVDWLLKQLCRGVNAAHKKGVIHRDLKPGNIMVVPEESGERLKVLDFGLAILAGQAKQGQGPGRLSLTKGAYLGTPPYMAPEQWRKEEAAASDIYAIGVILYEMLTGELPFNGSQEELKQQHLSKAPPDPSEKNDQIPPEVARVVLKALGKDPAHRYRTALDLLEAYRSAIRKTRSGPAPKPSDPELSTINEPAPSMAPPLSLAEPRERPATLRRLTVAAAAIVGCVGVGFGGYQLLQTYGPPPARTEPKQHTGRASLEKTPKRAPEPPKPTPADTEAKPIGQAELRWNAFEDRVDRQDWQNAGESFDAWAETLPSLSDEQRASFRDRALAVLRRFEQTSGATALKLIEKLRDAKLEIPEFELLLAAGGAQRRDGDFTAARTVLAGAQKEIGADPERRARYWTAKALVLIDDSDRSEGEVAETIQQLTTSFEQASSTTTREEVPHLFAALVRLAASTFPKHGVRENEWFDGAVAAVKTYELPEAVEALDTYANQAGASFLEQDKDAYQSLLTQYVRASIPRLQTADDFKELLAYCRRVPEAEQDAWVRTCLAECLVRQTGDDLRALGALPQARAAADDAATQGTGMYGHFVRGLLEQAAADSRRAVSEYDAAFDLAVPAGDRGRWWNSARAKLAARAYELVAREVPQDTEPATRFDRYMRAVSLNPSSPAGWLLELARSAVQAGDPAVEPNEQKRRGILQVGRETAGLLLKKPPQTLPESERFEVRLIKAACEARLGDWTTALTTYEEVIRNDQSNVSGSVIPVARFYEGVFDPAIELGKRILSAESNPANRKRVAALYYAKGIFLLDHLEVLRQTHDDLNMQTAIESFQSAADLHPENDLTKAKYLVGHGIALSHVARVDVGAIEADLSTAKQWSNEYSGIEMLEGYLAYDRALRVATQAPLQASSNRSVADLARNAVEHYTHAIDVAASETDGQAILPIYYLSRSIARVYLGNYGRFQANADLENAERAAKGAEETIAEDGEKPPATHETRQNAIESKKRALEAAEDARKTILAARKDAEEAIQRSQGQPSADMMLALGNSTEDSAWKILGGDPKNYPAAIDAFRNYIEKGGDPSSGHAYLGRVFVKWSEDEENAAHWDEARKELDQALLWNVNDAEANYWLARVYLRNGETDQALEAFGKTLAHPQDGRKYAAWIVGHVANDCPGDDLEEWRRIFAQALPKDAADLKPDHALPLIIRTEVMLTIRQYYEQDLKSPQSQILADAARAVGLAIESQDPVLEALARSAAGMACVKGIELAIANRDPSAANRFVAQMKEHLSRLYALARDNPSVARGWLYAHDLVKLRRGRNDRDYQQEIPALDFAVREARREMAPADKLQDIINLRESVLQDAAKESRSR